MTTKTTPRTVTINGERLYNADVMLGEHGEIVRWNGFVAAPLFSREVAERIVADFNADAERDQAGERFAWDGDVLVVDATLDYAEAVPERLAPDDEGRYSIGAFAYVWAEAWCDAHEEEATSLIEIVITEGGSIPDKRICRACWDALPVMGRVRLRKLGATRPEEFAPVAPPDPWAGWEDNEKRLAMGDR